jgi:hypothetical protein
MLTTFDATQRALDLDALHERVRWGWREANGDRCVVSLTAGERAALIWWHEARDLQWAEA